MPTNVSIDHSSQHQSGTVADGRWLVPTFVVPSLVVGLAMVLPGPLVLPAASILLLLVGFTLATANFLAPQAGESRQSRRRDLAAMLVLFGFVAAILTDAADALRVMGEIESALPGRQTAGR